MKKVAIVLEIQSQDDRDKMVTALANSGFKVWVTTEEDLLMKRYYVNIEVSKDFSVRELVKQ